MTRAQRQKPAFKFRRKLASLFFLAGCGISAAAAHAQGQTTSSPELPAKTYMKQNVFYLPVKIDDRVRSTLREVRLYYKEGADRPWVLKDKAAPGQSYFTFRAPRDGEYWFTVVTVDKSGRSSPADLTHEPPGLIVVQDTQLPQVDVHPLGTTDEGVCVQCSIRDANPDASKTHFYYQTGDMIWRPLSASTSQPDQFCIPAQAVFTGMVRVEACDLASNKVSREFNLGAIPVAQKQGSRVEQASYASGNKSSSKTDSGASVTEAPRQLPTEVVTSGNGPELVPVAHTQPAPQGTITTISRNVDTTTIEDGRQDVNPAPKTRKTPATRHLVNKTHVFLQYQVENKGPSGVGKIGIYITRDQGQSWQKLGDDRDSTNPLEFDLPGEGVFGVSLAVTNGRGFGGTPPNPGDAPDWLIEVDLTKPTAELTKIQPGTDGESACLVISWNVHDKNLANEPIDLFCSVSHDGPWQPIAHGVKNDGHYRWQIPANVGPEAFLRLIARDAAGNVTISETTQSVTLDDMSRPRLRVTNVSTAPPRSGN